jgi:hypothetical protein
MRPEGPPQCFFQRLLTWAWYEKLSTLWNDPFKWSDAMTAVREKNGVPRVLALLACLVLGLGAAVPASAQQPKAQVVTMITGFVELMTPDAWVVGGHIMLVNEADIRGEFSTGSVVTMHAYPTPISIWEAAIVAPAAISGLTPDQAVIEGIVDGVDASTIFVGGQSFKQAPSGTDGLQGAVAGMPARLVSSRTGGEWEVSAVSPAWLALPAAASDAPAVLVTGQQAADIAVGMFPDSRVTGMALSQAPDGTVYWQVQTSAGVAMDIDSSSGGVMAVAVLPASDDDLQPDDGSDDGSSASSQTDDASDDADDISQPAPPPPAPSSSDDGGDDDGGDDGGDDD